MRASLRSTSVIWPKGGAMQQIRHPVATVNLIRP
jgi:hypothetical protein